MRALLPEESWALQNDARDIGNAVVCGTRGWNVIADNSADAQNLKIYRRELMRLELSLKDEAAKAQGRPIVCMLHFPPFGEKKEDSGFTQLLEAYGVHTCVYGHLHGEGIRSAFEGERGGVRYKLVSCDSLGFRLAEIPLDSQM